MLDRVKIQPVTIAIYGSGSAFRNYSSGVIPLSKCDGRMDHAVTVVGYTLGDDGEGDADDAEDPVECTVEKWYHSCEPAPTRRLADEKGLKNYWKIQNQWGTWWGDKGFARFEIESNWSSGGVCGMYDYAEYINAL